MAVKTVNVAGFGSVTVTGTGPFRVSGPTGGTAGVAGTRHVLNANGSPAQVTTPAGSYSTFADTAKGLAEAAAIVAAVNA